MRKEYYKVKFFWAESFKNKLNRKKYYYRSYMELYENTRETFTSFNHCFGNQCSNYYN
jgi:hypothetical protein